MGLDISAGGYGFRAGSYSGFASFRDWLAQKIGFKDTTDYYEHFENKQGEWNSRIGMSKNARNMPLGPLMQHSDCDGQIGQGLAQKLLKELEDIKNNLPTIKKTKWSNQNTEEENEEICHRESLNHWVEACKEAIECKEPIYFG